MRVWLGAALALVLSACAREAPAPLAGEALIARGDYLVNGVVLCDDCHTPRGATGELLRDRALHGATLPPGAPPEFATIAPPLAGLPANYTEEQFVAFMQTGLRPDGSRPRPPMPPYRLNEEDARAVTAYIRSLPAAAQE